MQKRKVLSLEWKSEGVMDDESGELVELMEEVPLKELGHAKVERLVRGWRREAGIKLVPETRGSILDGTICYLTDGQTDGHGNV